MAACHSAAARGLPGPTSMPRNRDRHKDHCSTVRIGINPPLPPPPTTTLCGRPVVVIAVVVVFIIEVQACTATSRHGPVMAIQNRAISPALFRSPSTYRR